MGAYCGKANSLGEGCACTPQDRHAVFWAVAALLFLLLVVIVWVSNQNRPKQLGVPSGYRIQPIADSFVVFTSGSYQPLYQAHSYAEAVGFIERTIQIRALEIP